MNRFSLFLVALLYLPALVAQQVVESSPIGYTTVEEAFTALQADATATMTSYEGWTIFNQKDEASIYFGRSRPTTIQPTPQSFAGR